MYSKFNTKNLFSRIKNKMLKKKLQRFVKRVSRDRSWFTISNFLTIIRFFLIPFIVVGIIYFKWVLVFILLLVATMTDLFDGYLARRLNQQTALGSYLDPIADKLLLFSSFASLAFVRSPSFKIPVWFVLLLFIRELIMLAGTLIMTFLHIEFEIKPTIWGKLTTFFQSVFIFWIFCCYFLTWNPVKTYSFSIVLLALFSIFSLGHYTLIGIRHLKR